MIVTTEEQLHGLVAACQENGAFTFDVETRGDITKWPEVLNLIDDEWAKKKLTLKTTNPGVIERSKAAIEQRWKEELALDPLRNEVFWLGISTNYQTWAIPMGHKHGEVLVPEEIGDGSTVPPPGYRGVTASGKESKAKAKYYIPATYSPPPKQLTTEQVFTVLKPLFMDESILKIGHNVKFDARSLKKYLGDFPAPPYRDTMVMQHIVDEDMLSYGLETLVVHNFGHNPYERDGKLGSVIDRVAFSKASHYVSLDVRWTWLLYNRLIGRITKTDGLEKALNQDMGTLYVLMNMEHTGIPVDKRAMKFISKTLANEINDTLVEIIQHVPDKFVGFNPGSNPSKAKLLFGNKSDGGLGLKAVKKTSKGAPSVDAAALEAVKDKHPIVPLMLKWSEDTKIKNTFIDGLIPQLVDGRLHPSFHLHRTATGRLSSSEPNLQNIPRESTIRGLFVAPANHKLLVYDYDQIELRVMCMFSGDKKMSKFFLDGIDIHTGTAAIVFQKRPEEVTAEERQMGKGVNFLMGYGGGVKKLASQVGIDVEYAKVILDTYHAEYSGITAWKKKTINFAATNGYVSTMYGRRRRFPELVDKNILKQKAIIFMKNNPALVANGLTIGEAMQIIKSGAERQAINAVIQGSAADICKQAMINAHKAFAGTGAKLLVSVHDELVASCPDNEVEAVTPLMMEAMGHGSVVSGIPLKVSGHAAHSWAEAKGK